MMKSLLTFILTLFSVLVIFGQKAERDAQVAQGIDFYKQGDFKNAAKLFNGLLRKHSSDAEIMYWFARCYEEADEKQKAADLYLKAYKYNKKAAPDIVYKVGKAHHLKMDYKKALGFYNQYNASLTPDRIKKLESTIEWEHLRVDKMIKECESGIKLMAKPSKHKISNVGKVVNTPFEDYTPLISADNKKLFFTSRRPGGMSNVKDADNVYFEDIWYSTKNVNGTWSKPANIGIPVNSESHDACIALSPNGKQLFVYQTSNGGDIYSADLIDNKWTKPKSIGRQINSKYKEPSASISADGKTIYFSSDRPGGFGGLDIYWSTKDAKDNWSDPVNMGSTINTSFEDDGPFISFDGKSMYFSSNGHNSIGGFDIFRSAYDEKQKTWSKPINMGFPINSPDDDIFFVIAADKKTAYYASGKKGGYGEKDIFTIDIDTTYFAPPKPKMSKAEALANAKNNAGSIFYKGKVTDESGNPLECIIHVIKTNSDEKAQEFKTNTDGSFQIPLKKGAAYGVNTHKDGYIFSSRNVDLTVPTANDQFTEAFKLEKPKEGQKIVLKNIFYQIGKATLKKSSYAEVNILYDFLLNNPTIKIEVSGHTDNLGSKELNKEISTARAKTIYDILIKKGISKSRIKFAGYGSEKPIATNNTADGKRKNRRTEFEIIDI